MPMAETSNRKPMRSEVMLAFYQGLVEPSMASMLGIALCMALWFVAFSTLITTQFVANLEPGFLMKRPSDDYAHLTVEALHMKASRADPSIVFIGASSLKHGLVDVDQLQALLREESGRMIPVYNLTAPQLKIWEAANIISLLDDPGGHIFLVSLSAKKLAVKKRELAKIKRRPRIGFKTEAFDQELREYGISLPFRTGNYFVDNIQFFISRYEALLNVFTGPVEHQRYQDQGERIPEEDWEEHMLKMQEFFVGYPEMHEENFAALSRMVESASQVGGRVIFVQPPLNPRAAKYIPPEVRDAYARDVQKFAAMEGAQYWDIDAEMDYSDEDFHDWTHIREEDMRLAYSKKLMTHIAGYVKETDAFSDD